MGRGIESTCALVFITNLCFVNTTISAKICDVVLSARPHPTGHRAPAGDEDGLRGVDSAENVSMRANMREILIIEPRSAVAVLGVTR